MCNGCDWEAALTTIEEIRARMSDLPEQAEEFSASIEEKLESFAEWIDENEHVTSKMETAIENISRAVARWEE